MLPASLHTYVCTYDVCMHLCLGKVLVCLNQVLDIQGYMCTRTGAWAGAQPGSPSLYMLCITNRERGQAITSLFDGVGCSVGALRSRVWSRKQQSVLSLLSRAAQEGRQGRRGKAKRTYSSLMCVLDLARFLDPRNGCFWQTSAKRTYPSLMCVLDLARFLDPANGCFLRAKHTYPSLMCVLDLARFLVRSNGCFLQDAPATH